MFQAYQAVRAIRQGSQVASQKRSYRCGRVERELPSNH